MKAEYGMVRDIDAWMKLVAEVRWNFPGLETQAQLTAHRETVLRFMGKRQAICVRQGASIVGVMLFSRGRNMICCLAVSPEFRRRGIASALMDEALRNLDRSREITVTTFREEDEKGPAPRAFYEKFGFAADELVTELGHPCQVYILPPQTNRNEDAFRTVRQEE